ncbi:dihydrodipicolinate synthase family protein [Occultella kanbiaonis]|uniref:dihydrodipicolinate synthase family protein n=1 Tax=Occultella kanbiaonis TaxID=2675754 RepID=UPI0012B79DAC|nr:dihydrodipicolinate synthase family protein [Occultella kanbiaonis]
MTQPLERAHGIVPALLTPYLDDGAPNLPELGRLTAALLERGVAGFYVGGSTGDGVMQTPEERLACIEVVVAETGGQVPVIAHIGTNATRLSLDLAGRAAAAGVDAVSAILPSVPLTPAEQLDYFRTLARGCDVPFVAYNFPGRTGVDLSVEFFAALAEETNVAGVKFTSLDMFGLQQLARIGDGRLAIWNGHDEVALAGLVSGACGAIGSTFNAAPELFVRLLEQFRRGDYDAARATQVSVSNYVRDLVATGVLPTLRELLRLQGFAMGPSRHPLHDLDADGAARVRTLFAAHPELFTPSGL